MHLTSPLFPKEVQTTAGDLLFFFRQKNGGPSTIQNGEMTDKREAICAVARDAFADAFHVGIILEPTQNDDELERIVHAARDQVRVDVVETVVEQLRPDRVELCRTSLGDSRWSRRAAKWAVAQCGAAYNDIFSPECLNSRGQRAFYCCQLAAEAFKATNPTQKSVSPFLPHTLNFAGENGQILPYWAEHYRKVCPQNPTPPQGRPGSHPSKLRASPCVFLIASRTIDKV
uniref:Uncharacterized protein n=1 Tax=Globodera rostochiensis TaxID=31243 RepID=A0A914H1C3_GLORO